MDGVEAGQCIGCGDGAGYNSVDGHTRIATRPSGLQMVRSVWVKCPCSPVEEKKQSILAVKIPFCLPCVRVDVTVL